MLSYVTTRLVALCCSFVYAPTKAPHSIERDSEANFARNMLSRAWMCFKKAASFSWSFLRKSSSFFSMKLQVVLLLTTLSSESLSAGGAMNEGLLEEFVGCDSVGTRTPTRSFWCRRPRILHSMPVSRPSCGRPLLNLTGRGERIISMLAYCFVYAVWQRCILVAFLVIILCIEIDVTMEFPAKSNVVF